MPIILFLISICFLLAVGYVRKIDLISIYGVFILFSLLYNLVPALSPNYGIHLFSLSSNFQLIDTQLLVVSASNLVFGLVYFRFFRNVPYQFAAEKKSTGKKAYLFYCVVLFAVTCSLASTYGWHSFTFAGEIADGGAMFTITSYLKYFFAAAYLYYLHKFGLDRGAIFLMVLHTILMVIDGARTTYFPLVLLTLAIWQAKQLRNKGGQYRMRIIVAFSVILILVTRALVMDADESMMFNMLMSLAIEGGAGSYMSLQTIYAIANNAIPSYTFGTTYLIDPLVWLIPQGGLRESLLTYNAWIEKLSPILAERFAPMGGFYYVAEAMAFAPYVGPIIITAAFAFVSIRMEIKKNKYRLVYFAYFSTIGILFTKSIFGNVMKLFLIQLLFLAAYKLFDRKIRYRYA